MHYAHRVALPVCLTCLKNTIKNVFVEFFSKIIFCVNSRKQNKLFIMLY
uniref:Uncharacterized protein n=1 Tax=Anguilla anguilla TaxID=7936 RepID=A0A0E9S828_ANGAN